MGGKSAVVGRDDELRLVLAAVQASAPAVVLWGRAGIGKTTLARVVQRAIDKDAGTSAWVSGTPALCGVPFGTIAHVLPTERAPRDREAFAEWATAELRARAEPTGLVFVVDDADLLDADSARVLARVVEEGSAQAVLTLRSPEDLPPALRGIVDTYETVQLEVQALGRAEVRTVLDRELGGSVDRVTVERLTEASAGNPLFLHELIVAGGERGAWVEADGWWRWVGALASSARLADMVEERIEAVEPQVRDALDVVAYAEPIGAEIVAAIASASALDAAIKRGLATVVVDDRRRFVQLAHPLYAEVLRSRQPLARRRELAATLARAVEATGAQRRGDFLRVATWHLEAGDAADPRALVLAAEQAVLRSDPEFAERLSRAAVDADAGPAAYLPLAESLYLQGRYDESAAIHAAITVMDASDAVRAESAICNASVLVWGRGDADAADALLQSAAQRICDTASRKEMEAHRASILNVAGRSPEALTCARAVLDDPDAGARAHSRAASTTICALALCGRPDEAVALAAEYEALALGLIETLPPAAGGIVIGRCLGLLLAGRAHELEALTQLLWDISAQRPADDFRGLWAFLHGRAALARGRPRTAARRCREAATLLRVQDVGRLLPWCLGVLAQAEGLSGAAAAAAAAADAAEDAMGTLTGWASEIELGRVWATAAAGDRGQARTLALASADARAGAGQRSCELLALVDAFRLGGGPPVARRIAKIASEVDGPLARLGTALADAFELDTLSVELADLGADLLAAEVAVVAAVDFRRVGLQARSSVAMRRATDLGARCERAITLRRALADPRLGSLTNREYEIVGLAAQGLSRRVIAERLYVSERTVGNHLHRAYGKLGISSAPALAPWFDTGGAEPNPGTD